MLFSTYTKYNSYRKMFITRLHFYSFVYVIIMASAQESTHCTQLREGKFLDKGIPSMHVPNRTFLFAYQVTDGR